MAGAGGSNEVSRMNVAQFGRKFRSVAQQEMCDTEFSVSIGFMVRQSHVSYENLI